MLNIDNTLRPKAVKGKRIRAASTWFCSLMFLFLLLCVIASVAFYLSGPGDASGALSMIAFVFLIVLLPFLSRATRISGVLQENDLIFFNSLIAKKMPEGRKSTVSSRCSGSLSYTDICRMEFLPPRKGADGESTNLLAPRLLLHTKEYTLYLSAPRSLITQIEKRQRFCVPRNTAEDQKPPEGLWGELIAAFDDGTLESMWDEGITVEDCNRDIEGTVIDITLSVGGHDLSLLLDRETLSMMDIDNDEDEGTDLPLSDFADLDALLARMRAYVSAPADHVSTQSDTPHREVPPAPKVVRRRRFYEKLIPIVLGFLALTFVVFPSIWKDKKQQAEWEAVCEERVGEYVAPLYEEYRILDYFPLYRGDENFDALFAVEADGVIDVYSHCFIGEEETIELRLAGLTPEQGEVACVLLDGTPATMAIYLTKSEIPDTVTLSRRIYQNSDADFLCVTYH